MARVMDEVQVYRWLQLRWGRDAGASRCWWQMRFRCTAGCE